MSKPARKRWSCPIGKHSGVLAPGRLRKIDIRRFCLECSVACGVLVERVCKANEKKAEASKAKAARKAKSKRKAAARTRSAAEARQLEREHVCGVDIACELDRLWAHALKLFPEHPRYRRVPRLTISRSKTYKGPRGMSGRAWWGQHRVHLTIGYEVSRVRLLGVLAHEVGHLVAPRMKHSEVFWSRLAELVQHAYAAPPAYPLAGNHQTKQGSIEDGIELCCAWVSWDDYNPPRAPSAPGAGEAKVESVRGAS